ncbi:sensor histidine kinase [Geomobilimonas luticola]|uniref:histidine kinase n=1 Tax=Geomobilimonas luticola TaxID=1114878 RepID=A0ABS5SBW4_9BACT|nr:ATP-binding protein [Geomobilimonas luticola]MBT0652870.1 PAS domain-containing protein [Geomobilimonas luticola]
MNDDPESTLPSARRLRSSAEKRLVNAASKYALPQSKEDALKLVHELHVHQIELEMQNDELHRAQDELRSSRDRYSLLYDFAPVGYFTLDRQGMILTANLTGASLLNTERSRLIRRSFGGFFEGENYTLFKEMLTRVFLNSEPQTFELLMSKAVKRPLYMHVEALAVEPGEECLIAVVNITARKQAEDALSRAHDELEQRIAERTAELALTVDLQKKEMEERLQTLEKLRESELLLIQQSRMAAMGEMLTNIAHQWRQPLNVMGLLIQQLGMSKDAEELDRELIDHNVAKMMEILRHLSQTIDDFRAFTEPDREKCPFAVNQVIAKTLHLVESLFSTQRISITFDQGADTQLSGHPNEFCQALLNLLINARDALVESKPEKKWIKVCSRSVDGRAVVTVTDNGGGIRNDIIDNIFDPYFTTKSLGKGSGIGLYMSKIIIEKNMGGRLTVSNVAGGAEFRVEV